MKKFSQYISEQTPAEQGMNTSNIIHPSFLMCPPFNLYAGNLNNYFSKKYAKDGEVDRHKALNQFLGVYSFVSTYSMVYLIPHDYSLQDQSFVANLGIVLPHWEDGNTVVVSEFRSKPRVGEQKPGVSLFNDLNMEVDVAPKYFEGEADLKFFNENNYIGAYGIRTSIEALNWFERKYDMNIVKVENYDEKMYHLDCLIYPLYSNVCLAYTKLLSKQNIREIEKFAEIVDVPPDIGKDGGITNCVGLNRMVLCGSSINDLKVTDDDYDYERKKIDFLTKVCSNHSLEPYFFNLSEYRKAGADLSCMFMHLNYTRHSEEYVNVKQR
jgi:N-dimethylarginine dimethylaminohydrolase